MTRDAELPARDFVDLVLGNIASVETTPAWRRRCSASCAATLRAATSPPSTATARRPSAGRPAARRCCAAAEPGSDHQLLLARGRSPRTRVAADAARRRARAARRHAGRSRGWPSTPTCAGRCSSALVAAGAAGEARDRRRAGPRRHRDRAACTRPPPGPRMPTAEAKAEAWAAVVEDDELPNAVQAAVIGGFARGCTTRALLAPFVEPLLRGAAPACGPSAPARWPARSPSGCTRPLLAEPELVLARTDRLARRDRRRAGAAPAGASRAATASPGRCAPRLATAADRHRPRDQPGRDQPADQRPLTHAGQSGHPASRSSRPRAAPAARAVGQRHPPVRVLLVGARLVHRPPVADRVGQRHPDQPGRRPGEEPVQGLDPVPLGRPSAPSSPRSRSSGRTAARSASSTAVSSLAPGGSAGPSRSRRSTCSPAR